tara:strand:+ start:279 stop:1817 length:1539 start_codon:yes stop_codon:yes gene_type:complete
MAQIKVQFNRGVEGATNIVDAGTEGTKLASGTTAQRGSTQGQFRFNTTTGLGEYYTGTEFKTIDSPPTIQSIDISEVDSNAGGDQTVVITGGNFQSGAVVTFIGSSADFNASTTTVNSVSQITAVAPKASFLNAQEPYGVKVANPNGLSVTLASAINVDTAPTWTTSAGSLGTIQDSDTGTHFTVSASDADGDTVAYSVQSGSLPAGTSLNSSTGVISGDPTDVSSDTTSSFTLRATANSKTADRAFSIITTHDYGYSTTDLSFNIRARDYSFTSGQSVNDGTSLTSNLLHSVSGLTAEVEYGNNMYFYASSSGHGANIPNNKYFNFNGSSGSIEFNGSQSAMNTCFNGASSQSTAIWFHWSNDSGRQVLMSRYGTVGSETLQQWNQIVDPGREFHYNSSGVISGAAGDLNSTYFNLNTWHLMHKVYNVSDGIFRWYIDGSQVVTQNVGTDSGNGLTGYNNSTFPFSIGSRTDNSETFNNGSIGEARHYHRALTATEITSEWNATKGDYGRS